MSKVVKGIGRAISKVVKGVTNVVKKVVKSKLGKVLLTAATIYFGGAALAGGFQGAAAGQGFLGSISSGLSGAAQGVANAWNSLGTAASQALGGNFATAGKALSTGIQGGSATMAEGALVSQPLSIASAPITPPSMTPAPATGGVDMNAVLGRTPPQMSVPGVNVPPPSSPGLLASAMSSPYTAPAMIMSGTQLLGGAMQGYGAQKQQDQQIAMAEEEKKRYQQNLGTLLYPTATA